MNVRNRMADKNYCHQIFRIEIVLNMHVAAINAIHFNHAYGYINHRVLVSVDVWHVISEHVL